MSQRRGLLQKVDTKIKFVTTTPTPAGTLKTVYAIPLLPLIASSMFMQLGVVFLFCVYHGYLPVCLEIARAVGQEFGVCEPPRPDPGAPVANAGIRIPYGCGAKSYLGHLLDVIWVWVNLMLLLLVKYAPARGLFALRQRKRRVRHWLSGRCGGAITALGSDEDDEEWLRDKNKELMDELQVFNHNHIYSLTHDPKTFVRIPCLPEYEANGYGGRGDVREEDMEEHQQEIVENPADRRGEEGHPDDEEADADARDALALDALAAVDARKDDGEWDSTDND